MKKCELCKRIATDNHHKDGNHKNNKPDNLQNLCSLCHSEIEGRTPNKSELRRLVDFRDRAIVIKLTFASQIRSLSRIEYIIPDYWTEKEKEFGKYIKGLEKEIKKEIESNYPIWNWLKEIKGISHNTAAKLISHIDIENTPTVSALWRYCGLDATHIKRTKNLSQQESKKFGNPYLKKETVGILASNFIRKGNLKYKEIYNKEKTKELKNKLTKGHAHNRAKRIMIKAFLKDLFIEWGKTY